MRETRETAPMAGIRIRQALPEDDQALNRLDHESWSTLHAVLPRPVVGAPFFDRHPPGDFIVAEDAGGTVVGYTRITPPTPLACNRHVRQVQGLAVAAAVRGQGVGRALLRAACERAREEGAVRVTLRVLGHNAPARALYESEGFEVEGVLRGEFWIAGRYVDDVMMGRALL
ncbi:GNAT family N-acetyltransferase [Streptomyces inusitatus]|nr:GNAT family N-acetyltransferase [Streptomyces inusitatus]